MQSTASAAKAIFDQLTAARVRALTGHQQENHILEFKLVGNELTSRDDKRNLAAALSGFSNADGGVVVWGVEARRDPTDQSVDQVIGTPGVGKPKTLLSRLNDLTAQACLPVPQGVEHKILSGRAGPSFVASLVPASDSGPHMAKLGEDRYYTRSGGSFVRLEHFQVADMFGRRPAPVLIVEAIQHGNWNVGLRITNLGRGSARAPFILYEATAPFSRNSYGIDGNGNENLPFIKGHRGIGWLHAGGTDYVIHPTMYVDIGGVSLGLLPSAEQIAKAGQRCVINFKVGALGVEPISGALQVDLI